MQTILLSKTDRAADALAVPRGITSIVGGGGKTTLLLRLARELCEAGMRVVVTTSTHIFPPEGIPTLTDGTLAEASALLKREGLVCLGTPVEKGKLAAPKFAFAELAKIADYVLVEADGAKGLPLKAPAEHEPVIPAETSWSSRLRGGRARQADREQCFDPTLSRCWERTSSTCWCCRSGAYDASAGQRKGVLPACVLRVLTRRIRKRTTRRAEAASSGPKLGERVLIASLGQTERKDYLYGKVFSMIIWIRGAGDLASGIAYRCIKAAFPS